IAAGGYAAPERLADPAAYRGIQMQPLLAGYFVQPIRQGYKFEFVGTRAMDAPGPLALFGPTYETFVYVATPVDPGPPGRRTFGLYPDAIFATAERRMPTRKDTPIGIR